MVIVKEELEVNELKDRKFLIKRHIDDELTPENLIENHTQLSTAINTIKEQLAGLDAEKEKAKKNMEHQLKEFGPRLEALEKGIGKAKIWAKLNQDEADRKKGGAPYVG